MARVAKTNLPGGARYKAAGDAFNAIGTAMQGIYGRKGEDGNKQDGVARRMMNAQMRKQYGVKMGGRVVDETIRQGGAARVAQRGRYKGQVAASSTE